MDRLKTMRTLLLLIALCLTPLAHVGCTTRLDPSGPYQGNVALYTTDSSINTVVSMLDVFLKFELTNRAMLPQDVRDFANKVRRETPPLSKRILALRDVYALAPTSDNKVSLDTALKLLREMLTQSTAYLVEKSP